MAIALYVIVEHWIYPQMITVQKQRGKGMNDDLISRQAVFDLIRSLTRWCVRSENGKFNNVGLLYDDVMFGVDKLPSVNPQEPKTGHWRVYMSAALCSKCGNDGDEIFKYCPDCGAKMVEQEGKE